MTSSPCPQPMARTPRWRAVVPLGTAPAWPPPSASPKSCSNCSSFGPSDSEPERRASRSSSSSRGPTSGRASGIGSFTRRAGLGSRLEGVLERVDQGLPGGLDDVLRHADRPPLALAVRGIEQHPGDGTGAVVLVEDTHLVVGQLDVGEMRVPIDDGAAQRLVERVHRAVALRRAQVALAGDPDLDRRLGDHLAVLALLDENAEALEAEERVVLAGFPPEQQLEGGVGGLVMVAAVLALLERPQRAGSLLVVESDAGALGATEHRALARE